LEPLVSSLGSKNVNYTDSRSAASAAARVHAARISWCEPCRGASDQQAAYRQPDSNTAGHRWRDQDPKITDWTPIYGRNRGTATVGPLV